PAHGEDLLDDFPGLEVALEAEAARLAEDATEGAAPLRRDAHAPPGALQRDAHRLEHPAVGGAKEVLHEGVDPARPAVDYLQAEVRLRAAISRARRCDSPRTPSRSSRSSP